MLARILSTRISIRLFNLLDILTQNYIVIELPQILSNIVNILRVDLLRYTHKIYGKGKTQFKYAISIQNIILVLINLRETWTILILVFFSTNNFRNNMYKMRLPIFIKNKIQTIANLNIAAD